MSKTYTNEHGDDFEVLDAAYHRNGVAGLPFIVGVVKYADGDLKQIITLPRDSGEMYDGEPTFVTDPVAAAEGDVRFGFHSYRGDRATVERDAIIETLEARR